MNFYVPIDYYDLVNRAAKYGLLFLAVAFLAVFVLELTSGRRVHAVQYVFVGLAMILFYVLLLSLAEHVGFPPPISSPRARRAAWCRSTWAFAIQRGEGPHDALHLSYSLWAAISHFAP